MTATVKTDEFNGGHLMIDITGVASTDNAGQGSILNPFGVDVLVRRGTLEIITPSTGASNVSMGITTVAAAATDILNALDLNAPSAGDFYNCFAPQDTAKTQVSAPALWEADKYLTITASATLVGFTGRLYLEVIRAGT